MIQAFREYLINIIARIFSVVKLPLDFKELENHFSSTILVAQSKSIVIEGLLRSFASRMNVSCQLIDPGSQGIKFGNDNLLPASLNWVSLHDLDKIKLIESGESSASSVIYIRTFNVFQVKGPIKKWPSFKPSFFWLWGLLLTRRILNVKLGQKIDLKQQSGQRLLRLIKIDFVRTLKLVRGVPFEAREEQAKSILSGVEYEREIEILAERMSISQNEAKRQAEKAFFEMSASPKRFMYDALGFVARFIISRLFTDIQTRGLDKLIPAIKEHTVILVPMHRSHLDYVLVGYKLFSETVNPPLVAAGINLSFWPFGFLFRSVGAYFVKRNARDRFHTIVLKRYVSYLVSRGHLQEFFIEGGRSRSGKMLSPKLGLLSVIVESTKSERSRDVLFVPVSITYENVIEDETFSKENTGGSKVKESIISSLRALDVFKKRYGEVLIEFGEPISNRKFRENAEANQKLSERNLTHKLGFEICRAIRNQANPSLTSLCYSSLLMSHRYGLQKSRLVSSIRNLNSFLDILRKYEEKVGENTTQLTRFLSGDLQPLYELASSTVVKYEKHFGEEYFFIPGNRRFTADYYRNSVVHYFFSISFLSLTEICFNEITEQGLLKLYPLFEHDLLLEGWDEFYPKLKLFCINLKNENILEDGVDKSVLLFKDKKYFFPAMLASQIQSYYWVLSALVYLNSDDEQRQCELPYDNFISSLLDSSKSGYYAGVVNRTEALSRTSIVAVLNSLESRCLVKVLVNNKSEKCIAIESSALGNLEEEILMLKQTTRKINAWLNAECWQEK